MLKIKNKINPNPAFFYNTVCSRSKPPFPPGISGTSCMDIFEKQSCRLFYFSGVFKLQAFFEPFGSFSEVMDFAIEKPQEIQGISLNSLSPGSRQMAAFSSFPAAARRVYLKRALSSSKEASANIYLAYASQSRNLWSSVSRVRTRLNDSSASSHACSSSSTLPFRLLEYAFSGSAEIEASSSFKAPLLLPSLK